MNPNSRLLPSLQALATATYLALAYVSLLSIISLNCKQTETEKPFSISTPVKTTPTITTPDLDENKVLIGNLV